MNLDTEQLENLEGEIVRDIEEFTGNDEGECKAEWLKARTLFLTEVDQASNLRLLDLFQKFAQFDVWDGSTSALQYWKRYVVFERLRHRLSNV